MISSSIWLTCRNGRTSWSRSCRLSVGAHAGLACAFMIGSVDGEPDLLLFEAVEDQTIKDQEVIRKAAVAFDLVRGDALSRAASQELILKVANEQWNT